MPRQRRAEKRHNLSEQQNNVGLFFVGKNFHQFFQKQFSCVSLPCTKPLSQNDSKVVISMK